MRDFKLYIFRYKNRGDTLIVQNKLLDNVSNSDNYERSSSNKHNYLSGSTTTCCGIISYTMKPEEMCGTKVQLDILYPHKIHYCSKCKLRMRYRNDE